VLVFCILCCLILVFGSNVSDSIVASVDCVVSVVSAICVVNGVCGFCIVSVFCVV
jgi:hypothetical protein